MFHNSGLEKSNGPKLLHQVRFSTLSGNIFELEKKLNYLMERLKTRSSVPRFHLLSIIKNWLSSYCSFHHFKPQMKGLIFRPPANEYFYTYVTSVVILILVFSFCNAYMPTNSRVLKHQVLNSLYAVIFHRAGQYKCVFKITHLCTCPKNTCICFCPYF